MTEDTRPLAPAAVLVAGLAWTAWTGLVALAGASAGGVQLLAALSGLLLTVAFVAVVGRLHWTYGLPGGEGAGLGAAGGLLFGLGQLLRGTVGGAWAVVLTPGTLALVAGTALLGVGMVRVERTPPWVGGGLALGAVLFLAYAPGGVLTRSLALPLGIAWLAAGAHLLAHPERPSAPAEVGAVAQGGEAE